MFCVIMCAGGGGEASLEEVSSYSFLITGTTLETTKGVSIGKRICNIFGNSQNYRKEGFLGGAKQILRGPLAEPWGCL